MRVVVLRYSGAPTPHPRSATYRNSLSPWYTTDSQGKPPKRPLKCHLMTRPTCGRLAHQLVKIIALGAFTPGTTCVSLLLYHDPCKCRAALDPPSQRPLVLTSLAGLPLGPHIVVLTQHLAESQKGLRQTPLLRIRVPSFDVTMTMPTADVRSPAVRPLSKAGLTWR